MLGQLSPSVTLALTMTTPGVFDCEPPPQARPMLTVVEAPATMLNAVLVPVHDTPVVVVAVSEIVSPLLGGSARSSETVAFLSLVSIVPCNNVVLLDEWTDS